MTLKPYIPRPTKELPDTNAKPLPWVNAGERKWSRAAKRSAVLTTAAQMFNERGFHATSLDDVAKRLNVSKPTLYYYVKSKDDILLECVRQGLSMTLQGIEASRRSGGQAVDQLRACMEAYAAVVTQPFGMCLIRVGDQDVPANSRHELRRMKAAIDHEFRRLVAAAMADGDIAPCDPKLVAFTIAGGLSWIGRWYRPDGPYSREHIVQHSVDILLRGILHGTHDHGRRGCELSAENSAK